MSLEGARRSLARNEEYSFGALGARARGGVAQDGPGQSESRSDRVIVGVRQLVDQQAPKPQASEETRCTRYPFERSGVVENQPRFEVLKVATELYRQDGGHRPEHVLKPRQCVDEPEVSLIASVSVDRQIHWLQPKLGGEERRKRLLVLQALTGGDRFSGKEQGRGNRIRLIAQGRHAKAFAAERESNIAVRHALRCCKTGGPSPSVPRMRSAEALVRHLRSWMSRLAPPQIKLGRRQRTSEREPDSQKAGQSILPGGATAQRERERKEPDRGDHHRARQGPADLLSMSVGRRRPKVQLKDVNFQPFLVNPEHQRQDAQGAQSQQEGDGPSTHQSERTTASFPVCRVLCDHVPMSVQPSRLDRLLRPLHRWVWADASRRGHKLLRFAETEEDGGRDIARAAELTPDPLLRRLFLRHAQDEQRHAELFRLRGREILRWIRRASPTLGMYGHAFEANWLAPGERGLDNLRVESGKEDSLLAFLHLSEKAAAGRFAIYQQVLREDPATRGVFGEILQDEAFHMSYTHHQLSRVSPDRHRLRLWQARFVRIWRAYLRIAVALAGLLGSAMLLVQYFVLLPPFAWMAKRSARKEAQVWFPKSAPTSLRRQY